MTKEYRVPSAKAALDKCIELLRSGQADLFRGQTVDWPKLLPSLYRPHADKKLAQKELALFLDWSKNVPQMVRYRGNKTSLTAIAQHYGIATSFLDLTSDPEVAMRFAKPALNQNLGSDGVIYCFSESDLRTLKGCRIIRINVDNLWRLECQKGLFLHFSGENIESLRDKAIRIYFPLEHLTEEEKNLLYPERKSALEAVIDQWIYRRQIEDITETMLKDVRYVSMTHRETYPGIFRWRDLPSFELDWLDGDTRWIAPAIESVEIVQKPLVISLHHADFANPIKARQEIIELIFRPIVLSHTTGKLISFDVKLSDSKAQLAKNVSTLINRCWDGMRVFPYPVDELIESISLIAVFVIARAEGANLNDDWDELFFGETETVEVAPIGGHIEAGTVSKKSFLNAVSLRYIDKFTNYTKRESNSDPRSLFLYITDHWMLFDFSRFRKMFITEFIPSAVDSYWKEDLENYGGGLQCMWSLNFNPALLGYLTPFYFRFESPVPAERDCEKMIFILPDMEKEDIEELFISCVPSILEDKLPYQVRFHGYVADPRPIWEIPRVIQQAKWIIEVGGLSPLEGMPSAKTKDEKSDRLERPSALGAFEIWLIAKELLKTVNGKSLDEIKPIYDQFFANWVESNSTIESRAKAADDWPE